MAGFLTCRQAPYQSFGSCAASDIISSEVVHQRKNKQSMTLLFKGRGGSATGRVHVPKSHKGLNCYLLGNTK